MESEKPLARAERFTTERVGEETVVYDSVTHEAHNLNRVAEMVWRLCDGKTTLEQIAQRLRQDLDPAADLAVVETAVHDLSEAGLLEPMSQLPSRRQVAVGGLLIPVVASILIPTPAAAKSGKVKTQGGKGGGKGPKPKGSR